jgi:hypothetical protein
MSQGVIYYSTGEYYLNEAERSAASLRDVMPDVNITIYSDIRPEIEIFDQFIEIEPGGYPWLDRITYLKNTPYDKTLFLDTDTYISENIWELFEILDRFDVAAARSPGRFNSDYDYCRSTPESFPDFNCGVILYRNSSDVVETFTKWEKEYQPYADSELTDQPFFTDAIYQSNISVTVLPREYNCRFMFPGFIYGSPKILHGRDRSEYSKLAMVLSRNQKTPQVYTGGNHRRVYKMSDGRFNRPLRYPSNVFQRFYQLLNERGLAGTVRASLDWIREEYLI